MQLIDSNDVYKIIGQTGTARIHVADIDQIERIDPETLPIVKELREKLMLTEANQQHFKEERDEFEFKMREVAEAANAEIDRRNKTIAELREQLERVTAERDAAVNQLRGYCPACKNYAENHGAGLCASCGYEISLFVTGTVKDNWEWRGPQKEE